MKKEFLILASLSAMSLCTCEAALAPEQILVNTVMEDNHIPTTAEKIELKGKLNYGAGPDDIEAGATDNAVYIYFNQSYGSVSISLYNAEGNLCYSCVVNTGTQQLVVIPIMGNSNGTYTVMLENAVGYAEGDFERQSH